MSGGRIPHSSSLVLAEDFGYVSALRKREDTGRGARILRHNQGRDGCQADPSEIPEVEGGQCLDCCSTQASFAELVPGSNHDEESDDSIIEESQQ